jgi:hypothetical protein
VLSASVRVLDAWADDDDVIAGSIPAWQMRVPTFTTLDDDVNRDEGTESSHSQSTHSLFSSTSTHLLFSSTTTKDVTSSAPAPAPAVRRGNEGPSVENHDDAVHELDCDEVRLS